MYQRRSKSHFVEFSPEQVIGEIYFGTNERTLDKKDRSVIQDVAMMAFSELGQGEPVELSLLAQCDHRGSAAYNKQLSDQRLKVVADALAGHSLLVRKLDWVWAVSAGEELSVFKSNDRKIWARNRRVMVYWGKIDLSFFREVSRSENLPELAKYDLKKGFATKIAPSAVRRETIRMGR